MSLVHGSCSVTRYKVLGGPKRWKLAALNEEMAKFRTKPIKSRGVAKELLVGWARPLDDGETDEAHFDLSQGQVLGGFLLRIQIEKRKVPTQLLQVLYRRRLSQRQKQLKTKTLTTPEKKELLEDLKQELLEQCLPAVAFVEAYWRPESGEVLVFTTAKSALNFFERLFRKTFCEPLDLTLLRITPPLCYLDDKNWSDAGEAQFTRVMETTPTSFAAHAGP